jgi:predicted transcriptional regulator
MSNLRSEVREAYIIAKALVIAEKVLDAEKDVRYREPSDLADVRTLLKTHPYRVFVQALQAHVYPILT